MARQKFNHPTTTHTFAGFLTRAQLPSCACTVSGSENG